MIWRAIAIALLVSAASDALILLDHELGTGARQGWIITIFSSLALMARLDALMRQQQLFLDPDPTLAKIARRLQVPAKRLSAALNRATGENVSRYINAFRIEHACQRLAAGDNVTTAMLESGFTTKSNFNREFLRLKGRPPTEWLAASGAFPIPRRPATSPSYRAQRSVILCRSATGMTESSALLRC